jgi:hypothetical protein
MKKGEKRVREKGIQKQCDTILREKKNITKKKRENENIPRAPLC